MAIVWIFSIFSMNPSDLDYVLVMMCDPTLANPVAVHVLIFSLIFDDNVRFAVVRSSRTLNFFGLILIHLDIEPFSIQLHVIESVSLHQNRVFLRYIQNYQNYPRTYSMRFAFL